MVKGLRGAEGQLSGVQRVKGLGDAKGQGSDGVQRGKCLEVQRVWGCPKGLRVGVFAEGQASWGGCRGSAGCTKGQVVNLLGWRDSTC